MARAAGWRRWPMLRPNGGLGLAAISYVLVDYSRHISPSWHERLQPALWAVLILAVVLRAPFYRHWNLEIRSAVSFIASLVFLLGALLAEVLCVRFVTAVLGLDWHRLLGCHSSSYSDSTEYVMFGNMWAPKAGSASRQQINVK